MVSQDRVSMMTVSNSGLHGNHVKNISDSSPVCFYVEHCNALNKVSLLTKMQLFISQPIADREKSLVFSGLSVHCLM